VPRLKCVCVSNPSEKGKTVSNVTTVGIDLAKNVFSVHGVDSSGHVLVRRTIGRGKLLSLVAQLPPCVIGLEACSGAHEWARQFRLLGHDARLMAPKFVTPYRKSGKNDGNDAEAICEAVSRPSMRFVPVKSIDQQAVLTLHRVRQGFIEERTASINRIRGLLAEFGVVLPQRAIEVRRGAAACLDRLPLLVSSAIRDLLEHIQALETESCNTNGSSRRTRAQIHERRGSSRSAASAR
jgi:transposase